MFHTILRPTATMYGTIGPTIYILEVCVKVAFLIIVWEMSPPPRTLHNDGATIGSSCPAFSALYLANNP